MSYAISADGKRITCGRCGLTSHNPNDVAQRYCGNCKIFHDDPHQAEFDCEECGRHIIQFGGPFTRRCAACTTMPGWFRDADLAKRIDPDYQPREG
jgi:hypothetical protein